MFISCLVSFIISYILCILSTFRLSRSPMLFCYILCILSTFRLSPFSFAFSPFLLFIFPLWFPLFICFFYSYSFFVFFFVLSFSFLPPCSVFISWGRLPDSSFPALLSSPSCCSFSSLGCPYSPRPPLFRSFLVRFYLDFLLLIFLSWLSSSFFILCFSSSFLSYFPVLLFSPLHLLLLFLLLFLLLLGFFPFFVFSSSIGRSFCFPFLASSLA